MGFHNFSMNKKYEVYPQLYRKSLIAWSALESCRGVVTKPNFNEFGKTELNTYLKESLNLLDKDIETILTLWEKEYSKDKAIEAVDNFWRKNQEHIAENEYYDLNNYSLENEIYLSKELCELVDEIKEYMRKLLSIYMYPDQRESTSIPSELRENIKEKLDHLNQRIKKELKINKTSKLKLLWNKLSSAVRSYKAKKRMK
jgi:hypothetical protein